MHPQPMKIVGKDVTDRDFRDAFGHFPSGVVALCGYEDGKPIGMVASSFTSVSIDPPLLLVCIRNESGTWRRLHDNGRIGVSVLSEAQDDACLQLASLHGDRFANLGLHITEHKAVLIEGAVAWFECEVTQELPAGDHLIALLRIVAMRESPEIEPLIFHRSSFHKLRT